MTAFRARLAQAEMSACRQELPAETALAEARVMPLVLRMRSSAVAWLLGGLEDSNSYRGTSKGVGVGG